MHHCYIINHTDKVDEDFQGYIFFDFETYECRETHNHIVNLAMARKVCKNCFDNEDKCNECQKPYVFYSIDEFCEWSLNQKNTIQIAHNFKGFDGIFIMRYISKNRKQCQSKPQVILRGTKLISIKFNNIKYIDSYSLIPMANFPKTFGMTESKKEFFSS